jgi:outer membrane biosynthesis protein TonB
MDEMTARKLRRRRAVLLAGVLASATPALTGFVAHAAGMGQDDKAARKAQEKAAKAQKEAAEDAEDARKKEAKAKAKQEKEERERREDEQKKRDKQQRKEEKERRKHGGPAPVPTPTPTPTPTPKPTAPPAPVATPGLAPRERLAHAVDLLEHGQEPQARAELKQLLTDQPDGREAKALQETLDSDPVALFGAENFAVKVGPRDSLITLAIAYLGDSYRFYGLARYNHIAVPADVKPGDTIQIPGRQRPPAQQHRPTRPDDARPATPTPVATPEPRPEPAQPRANPARAQQMRRAGLERMSAGSIDQAVSLLEQASRLDPGNAAIAADLGRARRIQSVVHHR